ncbi:hypothetical protein [Pseudoxanthomonas suwonensis]
MNDGELKVMLDNVWSSSVGGATLFHCLFTALKLQPGIDAATLENDLRDQLASFADSFSDSSMAGQTVKLAMKTTLGEA